MRTGGLLRPLLALVPPGVFAIAGWLLWGGLIDGALLGGLAWLVLRLGPIRMLLMRDHNHGMAASRDDAWEDALAAFQRSEQAWRGRPMLDRWRAPLLGSSGRWPYIVLARYNQALCLVQLDRLDQARAGLDALLHDHPELAPARQLRGALAVSSVPGQVREHTSDATWYEE